MADDFDKLATECMEAGHPQEKGSDPGATTDDHEQRSEERIKTGEGR